MKRHLTTMTLLALLLAAAGTLKAQQAVEFAPVGAEWYYERLYREGWNLNGITYDRFGDAVFMLTYKDWMPMKADSPADPGD